MLRGRSADVGALVCILSLSLGVAAVACTTQQVQVSAHSKSVRSDCYACHALDYQQAPRHVGVKPTRCAVCHHETAWHPTQLNHPWPLTGAHAKANCFDCHKGSPRQFEHTDKACVGCHRTDYDNSDYPGHDKFALTCQDCHSTKAWKPADKPKHKHNTAQPSSARANEHRAREKLTRAHETPTSHRPKTARSQPTSSAPPPTHRAPAEAARHATVKPKSPQAATNKTATSKPSTNAAPKPKHPENAFPITTGNHTDIECKTCHDGPGKMGKANTDCVQCHKRSKYDRKHSRVSDYPTGAAAPNFCVDCHTRGTVRPVARGRR